MNEREYRKIVNNPRHIPGVHNYCDRWCERCPLTLRCSVFATEGLLDEEVRPPHDKKAESLWPRLESLRPLMERLVAEHVEHPGIPMAADPKFKGHDRPVDKHRLGAAAKRYMEFVHPFVKERGKEIGALPAVAEFAVTPGEAFEVIAYYHMSITVKLSRALRWDEMDEEMAADPEMADVPRDQDGSAKLVMILIERSPLAWAALHELAPAHRETVLRALMTLSRLRPQVAKAFPKAEAFVRPGFDTLRFGGK